MYPFGLILIFPLVSFVSANGISFFNTFPDLRIVCWFPANGYPGFPGTYVYPGAPPVRVDIPNGWTGMFRTIRDGQDPFSQPASNEIEGEVTFQGFNGLTYFDISAIVDNNAADGINDGVHWIYPLVAQHPASGCNTFPCSGSYNQPDDVQTKYTPETELTVVIGSAWWMTDGEV